MSDKVSILSAPSEVFSDTDIAEIGRLRYNVWSEAGTLDTSMFPEKTWIDDMDFGKNARHWVIKEVSTGVIIAAARLTRHESLEDDYRDVKLWKEKGFPLKVPLVDFGRQCVRSDYRRRGCAKALDEIRIIEAKTWTGINGIVPKNAVCTCSDIKVQALCELGFFPINQTAVFADRPTTTFHALQYNFE
jgi:predicted GNAT family N-acyltransferase